MTAGKHDDGDEPDSWGDDHVDEGKHKKEEDKEGKK